MGSVGTDRLYAIDPRQWTLIEEAKVPGKPWGMTVVGDELRVVCGVGEDDDRVIRRFVPGHGFKSQGAIECPDATGSQLSYDGTLLYLSQWYKRRILGLDERGNIVRQIDVPHQICGQCYVDGKLLPRYDRRRRERRVFSHASLRQRCQCIRRSRTHPLRGSGARLRRLEDSGRTIERRIKSSHLIAEQFASNDPHARHRHRGAAPALRRMPTRTTSEFGLWDGTRVRPAFGERFVLRINAPGALRSALHATARSFRRARFRCGAARRRRRPRTRGRRAVSRERIAGSR